MCSATLAVMLQETPDIDTLSEPELRALASRLMGQLQHQNALLEKLTLECAMLKRLKFAAKSEALPSEQRSLLQDDVEADLQALAEEIEQLEPTPAQTPPDSPRQTPKRQSLPAQLPRQEFRHEPDSGLDPFRRTQKGLLGSEPCAARFLVDCHRSRVIHGACLWTRRHALDRHLSRLVHRWEAPGG